MRTIIAIFFMSYVLSCAAFQSPSSYNKELSNIVSDFKEVIMDEEACDDLKDRAEDIAEDIEELLGESEDFSSDEIAQLKQLKTEAEGIEDFIAVIAGIGTAFPKFEDFNVANKKFGVDIFRLSQYNFCIDILVAEIDDYRAYLALNNSSKNVRLKIQWKTRDGSSSGTSEVGMVGQSVRHILDNRDKTLKNNINFQNISCQEIKWELD